MERQRTAAETKKGKEKASEEDDEEKGNAAEEEEEVQPPTKKAKKAAAPATAPSSSGPSKPRPQEFAPAQLSSAPRRLNDIALAPPTLTLPRFASKAIAANKAGKDAGESAAARMGLSLAQQRILGEERERVIRSYRELKERKLEAIRAAKGETSSERRRGEEEEV